ncbi:MAG TPA: L-histidine N(alpha)-methyltransferase [Candidatus Polarisedimenticolia bacterium]|nr:L-histidine N(alpha)-methyltransferase [Candidatus Polarisedimenticolia bacterium]
MADPLRRPAPAPAPVPASTSLGHYPAGPRWEFDQSVADVFDDMLRRSIPQYEVMRDAVHEIARRFVLPDTAVVDLGCSRGDTLAPLIEEFGPASRYIACDVSEPMLEVCRGRFAREIDAGTVDVRHCDLRREFPACRASVVLSVLTLQFTPIEYRRRIVEAARESIVDGGAFILVEKVFGQSARVDRMLEEIYLRFKAANGYTEEEIMRKKLSLEGVLVPLDAGQNAALLRESGFRSVECFWRWMNFSAWVAVT